MVKMDRESAAREFERWAEALRVDLEWLEKSDENTVATRSRRKIEAAIRDGAFTVDGEGFGLVFSYTPIDPRFGGKELKFRRPTGVTYMAMDAKKSGEDRAKIFATIAEMTETPAQAIAQLDAVDIKVFEAIWFFLFGG